MTSIGNRFPQRGIGLIELMIAITLSLVLSAAVIQVFVSSKNNYRLQDSVAILQENGRFAISYLAEDIRMAGFSGCSSIDKVAINNVVKTVPTGSNTQLDPNSVLFDSSAIVRGVDNVQDSNATFGTSGLKAKDGTDVLIVRRAVSGGASVSSALAAFTSDIPINVNSLGLKNGDVLVISDCANADLFRVTTVTGAATAAQSLSHDGTVNTSSALSKQYGKEAEVLAFQSATYFVRDTTRTTPQGKPIRSLFVTMRTAGQGGVTDIKNDYTAELVEGVEDMQLEYGVDTNADGNNNVDTAGEYKTANNVTAAEWSKVVSVRINLLMQSTDDSGIATSGSSAQTYKFNNVETTGTDGRLRQVFYSVVGIRNRLL